MSDETKPTASATGAEAQPGLFERRPGLKRLAELAVTIGLAFLAARFGIVIPTPPQPLVTVVTADPSQIYDVKTTFDR